MSHSLSEAVGDAHLIGIVGLAKNTGKTVALSKLVGELGSRGEKLGITSVGRDGEARDVLDPRIRKPRIDCPAGSLVATAAPLLDDGPAHEVLERTGLQTALGEVVVARIRRSAPAEIAGPSTADGIRAVAETMAALSARRTIVDGSLDRRVASSPRLAEAVVIATGAVLGRNVEEVSQRTRGPLELAELPPVADEALREQAAGSDCDLLIGPGGDAVELPPHFNLTMNSEELRAVLPLGSLGGATLAIRGALPQQLLDLLIPLCKAEPLAVVVVDATKVFLTSRSPHWYRERGLRLEVLRRLPVRALTVNPVAPLSHSLASRELREAIAALAPTVPVFDVESEDYGRNAFAPLAA
jgi:hypothetical protein